MSDKFPELCPSSVLEYLRNEPDDESGYSIMVKLAKMDESELRWLSWMLLITYVKSVDEAVLSLGKSPCSVAGLNGLLALGKFYLRPEYLEGFRVDMVTKFTQSISNDLAVKLEILGDSIFEE